MAFIHPDFLLSGEAAKRLFHDYAEAEPILDYHSHLPPKDIAENRRFANLFEIWLEGDHYKWRAMRANGVPEEYCTGSADPWDKFLAYARTVPYTLRNPLYHWTHLELKRYFDIDCLLDESTAKTVWDRANERLESEELSVHGILRKFHVRAVCTTDDPADPLDWHAAIALSKLETKVYPTFRPDKAMNVDNPGAFNAWLARLGATAGIEITSLEELLSALRKRHDDFHAAGCRLSDHGLNICPDDFCIETTAAKIFNKARGGVAASVQDRSKFASFLMLFFGHLDHEKGWTKQLHLGARRNNNTRMFRQIGPDTGFDSMGDLPQASAFCSFLDRLEHDHALPKIVVYNNNPVDNYALATAIGNFQDSGIPGKIQFGSGWWFLDQKEGMEMQINALSNCGLLSRFVGMLTDSRSFLSFPRHEYFRRTLSNLVGRDMDSGELPDSFPLVGGMVKRICYENARDYFKLPDVA
jgi:glucuronate isomerase